MRLPIALSALLAALLFGSASVASATPLTIDFTGVAKGRKALTTYAEDGFTVTNGSNWFTSTDGGDPAPQLAGGKFIGGSSAFNSATFSLTDAGGSFYLTGFDVRAYMGNPVIYEITLYGTNGTDFLVNTDSSVGFSTISLPSPFDDVAITHATFTFLINPGAKGENARFGIDNITLDTIANSTPTPEPSSMALLATGMMGVTFLVGRRKVFNS